MEEDLALLMEELERFELIAWVRSTYRRSLAAFAPRDVPAVVSDYLEAAHARGFVEVRLIHGRGIGVQRTIVQSLLARHPLVAAFADAPVDVAVVEVGLGGSWDATNVVDGQVAVTGTTIAALAPGASDGTSWSGTYAIQQHDIDVGFFDNTAVAVADEASASSGTAHVDLS